MRHCENCGAQIPDGAMFCEECGTKVEPSFEEQIMLPKDTVRTEAKLTASEQKEPDQASAKAGGGKQNGTIALIILVIVVALAGGGIFFYSKGKETKQSAEEQVQSQTEMAETDTEDIEESESEDATEEENEITEATENKERENDTAQEDKEDSILEAYYSAKIFPVMRLGYKEENNPCAIMLAEYDWDTGYKYCTFDEMLAACVSHQDAYFAPPRVSEGRIITVAKWDAPTEEWYNGLITYDQFMEQIDDAVVEIAKAGVEMQHESTGYVEGDPGDEILPDSDERYLTESDLSGLTAQYLTYARNEIYARHGRPFQSAELQDYFYASGLYEVNQNYQDSQLSDMEKKNAELISDYQNKHNLNYKPN